jgi:hypothetical protein
MENNQTENLTNLNQIDSGIETSWRTEVTGLLKDLWYPSESDEPIEWVSLMVNGVTPLTISDLELVLGLPPETTVEEITAEQFWGPVVTVEDWYGEDEQAQVASFLKLKLLLESNLKNLQAFRVGQIEIDLYLLGQINDSEWGGLKTKVIET